MTTISDLRHRPFDTCADAASPDFLHVRVPGGTIKVGVSREDATEFFGSALFRGGIAVMSFSAWSGTRKRETDPAEVLAVVDHLFGRTAMATFRTATLGAGPSYVVALTAEDRFVAPTPLQDAVMSRRLRSVPLLPG